MDPRSPAAASPTTDADEPDGPTLSIDGLERSSLRVGMTGIEVCLPASLTPAMERFWPYAELADLRIADYGAIGVIRATLQRDRTDLPLLLLEQEQIPAASRTLEIVLNRLPVPPAGRTAA
jgi:hypothetical protein